MSKQFKLVYENAGELKGSYTGIPANNDVDVIKRTVLEGKEVSEPTIDTEYITDLESLNPYTLIALFTASSQEGELGDAIRDLFERSKWHCLLPIEDDSEEYFDCVIWLIEPTGPQSADLSYFPAIDSTQKYICQCAIEIDSETGDARLVFSNVIPEVNEEEVGE